MLLTFISFVTHPTFGFMVLLSLVLGGFLNIKYLETKKNRYSTISSFLLGSVMMLSGIIFVSIVVQI